MNHDQNVRDAAQALHEAIVAAEAEGHHVQWPRRAGDLPGIAVSEMGHRPATIHVDPPKARRKKAPDAE